MAGANPFDRTRQSDLDLGLVADFHRPMTDTSVDSTEAGDALDGGGEVLHDVGG